MATFTHTVTWTVNIDGRVNTVTYSYDIENVTNVQKMDSSGEFISAERRLDFTTTPALVACVAADIEHGRIALSVEDTGSGAGARFGGLHEGMATVLHLSSAGGNMNATASNATTTLVSADYVTVDNSNAYEPTRCTLIALHQASS